MLFLPDCLFLAAALTTERINYNIRGSLEERMIRMSPVVFSLLLWIPFLLTVTVAGILFCRSGYRKGIWRALIAFGATLLAAGLSILLAGLVSSLAAPAITGIIPVSAFGSDPLTGRVALALAGAVIRSILSMILFWLLMLIFTMVLRAVSTRIQRDKLITTTKPLRWAGLGVGALSALVFALLWLCPLYSSLAIFAPIADNALSARSDQSAAQPYLQSVRQHPVVAVSGTAPMRLFYNGVSATSIGSTSVPVTNMADVLEEAAVLVSRTANTDDTAVIADNGRQLVALMRNKVANQKWFHGISMVLVKEASAGAAQIPGGEGAFLQQFIDVFDLPQDVFAKNCDALLAFFDYALANGIVDILQEQDWNRLYSSGILEQAGKVANYSDEAVELKKLLITAAIASSLFEDDYAAAQAYLKDYPIDMVTEPALQLREAETIMQYMFMSPSPAELVLRYPALGEPALKKMMEQADLMAFSGLHPVTQDSIRAICADRPRYLEDLYAQALYCAQAPIGSASFQNSCNLLLAIRNFSKTGVMSYYDAYDSNSLRFAMDTVTIDPFTLLPAGKKIFVIMDQYPELLEKNPSLYAFDLSSGVNGVHGFIFAAVRHTILNDPEHENVFDLETCLRLYTHSPLMTEAVKQYVSTHDSDPLLLASKLSPREVLALQNLIDGYCRDNYLDPDALSVGSHVADEMQSEDSATMTVVVSGGELFTPDMTAAEIEAYNKNLEEALANLKLLLGI